MPHTQTSLSLSRTERTELAEAKEGFEDIPTESRALLVTTKHFHS